MYEARAFEPMAFCIRHFWDERTGQVAVIWKPVSTRAVSIVSQPVVRSTRSAFPLPPASSSAPLSSSSCLKA
jgi:hypothetical protein